MSVLPARMTKPITFLILGLVIAAVRLEVVEQGPSSGIVLKEQPGLLITNCQLHTQKVFVRLNPREVCRKHVPTTTSQVSWAARKWERTITEHAEMDIAHMLQQLQKFTVTQSELSRASQRSKRFIGGLLTAASLVGSLFGLGLSAYNSVNVAAVQRHVGEMQAEIPEIRKLINRQQHELQTIGQSLKGTILIVNTHSEALNQTMRAVDTLLSVVAVDYAHTQLVSLLMGDMLRDITSSVDSLAMGRIPPYLVPLSLVQSILASSTRDTVTPLQAHLAYTLGSAVPIHVDPEMREIGFILNLPIIASESIYRLKAVVNVGVWQGDTHIKIQTPPIIAYHDSSPELYLVPNLRMCTVTKDIHYLCPSKPFIQDNTDGICGLTPMTANAKCPTTITPRLHVTETRAEIVGSRWLVNTPAETALLTYDQHDTTTRLTLPGQTLWVTVPRNAITHIGDSALYYLNPDQYESEIEVSEFFSTHPLELDPETLLQVRYKGTQTIDVTPVDNVLREIATQSNVITEPLAYTWSAPDTILALTVCLSYVLILVVAALCLRRTQTLQRKVDKCNHGLSKIVRRRVPDRHQPTELQEIKEDTLESTTENVLMAPAILELVYGDN